VHQGVPLGTRYRIDPDRLIADAALLEAERHALLEPAEIRNDATGHRQREQCASRVTNRLGNTLTALAPVARALRTQVLFGRDPAHMR